MEHNESSVKVYHTKEYARFRMITGNRPLNEGKINRIIREIRSGNDMLKYSPIQVAENGNVLDILDGQHRFFIARKLGRSIYYVLVNEKKTMIDIARVNSNVEKWKAINFIECYAQLDNQDYIILRDFIERFGINVGTSINILSNGNPTSFSSENSSIKDSFQNGTFKVNCHEQGVALAEDCIKFSSFEGHRSRPFIIAIHRIREAAQVNVDELAAAHLKYPDFLKNQVSAKDYIYHLEQLFNNRKHNRTIIA